MDSIVSYLHAWLSPLEGSFPEMYVVGGAVRDYFLSRFPKDIDLICHEPHDTADRIAQATDATVVPFTNKTMQPCYRIVQKESPDDFLDLAAIQGGSLEADLLRRDFTINAMAMPVLAPDKLGEVVDPASGQADLESRRIRSISSQSFDDDPVRMLRAYRFAAQLGFALEAETLAAIAARAETLKRSAAERLASEWLLLAGSSGAGPIVRLMDSSGLLEALFPEIRPMRGCIQNAYHHLDVWEHSLLALEECEEIIGNLEAFFQQRSDLVRQILDQGHVLPLLKTGALLHDMGKPATRGRKKGDERITFYNHDQIGAELLEGLAERLKLSAQDRRFLSVLAAEHVRALELASPRVKKSTILGWFRKLGDWAVPVLMLSMADVAATRGQKSTQEERKGHQAWAAEAIIHYLTVVKPHLSQSPLITGRDLIDLGLEPGPMIGEVLRKVEAARDEGRIRSRESALHLAKEYISAMKRKNKSIER
jgi:putative nucleotidyltransferase with HDIG domain